MGKIVYNGREYLSAGTASTMQGATSTTDGVSGLVPQPLIADREKFLKGDGTWGTANEVTANPQDTPTDELTSIDIDGTVYEIMGGGSSNLIIDAEIYSEDEKQVGVWIDGRPLYRKTVKSTTVPNSGTWTSILLDLPSDAVIKMYSAYYRRTNNRTDLIPQYNPSSDSDDWLFGAISSNNFVYKVSSPYISNFIQTDVIVTYIKSNDAAGSGGYQAWGFSPIIYSTEEREVGVWIDNKPLYQKTYLFNSLTNVPSGRWFDTGFTATDISIVGEAYGFYQDATAGVPVPILASCDSGTNQPLNIYLARNVSTEMHGFTIQYTKTTDVAGSGSYNTLGIPNVHYSTDEQVIGTWIDGRPIYMKCFQLSNYQLVRSVWTTINDVEVPNIDDVVEITVSGYDTANNRYPALGGLLSMRFNGDKLQYYLNVDYPIYVKTIILRYTKNTD